MKNNPKKSLIIKAAQKRFARHGLVKTTIEEIARDLRIGKASIYNYFTSKEEIFREVLSAEVEKFMTEMLGIFNNPEIKAEAKILSYLKLKECTREKYVLIYNMVSAMFRDFLIDEETDMLNLMLEKEEAAVTEFLKKDLPKKLFPEKFPSFLINLTWGMTLTNQLDIVLNKYSPDKNVDIMARLLKFCIKLDSE